MIITTLKLKEVGIKILIIMLNPKAFIMKNNSYEKAPFLNLNK